MRTPAVLNRVRWFMAGQPAADRPGVVAVSGGADSVALLRALHAVRTGPLTVAHFDHGLRGDESDADAEFVRDLATQLTLTFRLGRGNLSSGSEAAARRQRYDWLVAVAAEEGAGWVATGHTADDQAETVLHRLIRGTGLDGLRGIPAAPFSRGPAGAEAPTLRPLLTATRAEVLAYLSSINQPFREDSSNADTRFTRNRIRHELLPLLRTFNPDVVAALNRLAGQAAEAHEVVVGEATDLLTRAELPRAGGIVVLNPGPLMTAPRLVVRETLRRVWEREGWPMGDMTADHWGWAVDVAVRDSGRQDFPGGVTGHFRGPVVTFGRAL